MQHYIACTVRRALSTLVWSGISVKNKIRYAMQNVLQVDLQFVLQ